MFIALIRHAEPEWVRNGFSQDNPPLTARGHRQARRLADRLEQEHFDHVYVSPLLRARQTAAPILAAQCRGEVVESWLEEIRSPIWQGDPAEKAEAAYREEKRRPAADRWQGLAGGEAVSEFTKRIHAGANTFLAERGIFRIEHELPVWHIEEPGDRLAFIAHAGTNSVFICHLLGLAPTPWEWERFVIGHATVSRLEALKLGDGYTFSLTRLADNSHLDEADHTF